MSFSHQVKDELAHQWPGKGCCRTAELSAIIRMDGALHLRGGNRFSLHVASENAAVTRKSLRLLSDLYDLPGRVTVRRSRLSRANNYMAYFEDPGNLSQALNELGILDDSLNLRSDVPGRLIKTNCCAAAYVRGLFLGGGFVSSPRGQYHLELTTDNQEVARTGRELLSRFDIDARLIEKGSRYTVYLKQAQAIMDFMTLIGAYSATLAWEDVRTVKDVRANVNRLVNCDTANLHKAVLAAMEQLRDIEKIDGAVGLSRLPRALKEIADARIAHPQANLAELGEECVPKLTKSAAYHRIRRLQQYAEKL